MMKPVNVVLFAFGLLFLLPALPAVADEFKVLSFRQDPSDISAIVNTYKRYDDNDEICAIIKVRSDLNNLRFTASNPVVGNVELRNGEYWVYISGGTRQLNVFTEGFIKFSYTFPVRIEKGKVYILELSSKSGSHGETGKGTLIITSSPKNIKVGIDGFPDLEKQTPCTFENYRAGNYRFEFYRNRYHPLDSIITIEKNTQKQIHIRLRPDWGNLVVATVPADADFEMEGRLYTGPGLRLEGEVNGLKQGSYALTIRRKNYRTVTIEVEIRENDTAFYNVELEPVLTPLQIKSTPEGADVFIDGKPVGTTPFNTDGIITGEHTIRLEKKGFVVEEETVFLEEDRPGQLLFNMKNHARISIESTPPGAVVWLDGEYKGKTPLKLKVLTGKSKLRIAKEHFIPVEKTIVVTASETFRFTLAKQKYRLSVESVPSGAALKVNGISKGRTPESFTLAQGRYKVTVEENKYMKKSKRINLNRDRELRLRLSKRYAGYVGFSFIVPANTDYELFKYGLEIGWTYKKASQILTSLGYNYKWVESVSSHIPSSVKIINTDAYQGLDLSRQEVNGFAEQRVFNLFLRLGYVLPKPQIALSGSVGLNSITGYEVFNSDNYYNSNGHPDILPGDKFINANGEIDRVSFIYGLNILIPVSMFYISVDYWVSGLTVEYSPKLMFGIGIGFR